MLRGKVQHIIGQVSDNEFARACGIITRDIKGNKLWLKQKTTIVYIVNALIIAVQMLRRQEKSA